MKIIVITACSIGIAAAKQLSDLNYEVLILINESESWPIENDVKHKVYKNLNDNVTFDAISRFKPDYIFSIHTGDKIPNRIINAARRHALNFHPAPLPQVRAGNAFHWVIALGLTKSAITVHKLTSEWDAGDIAYEHSISLSSIETLSSYLFKVEEAMPSVIHAIHNKMQKRSFDFKPQKKGGYYPRIKVKETYINWTLPATQIETLIRRDNNSSPAVTCFRGYPFVVYEAKVTTNKCECLPGSLNVVNGQLYVATADKMLHITVLKFNDSGIYSGENFIKLFGVDNNEVFSDIRELPFYRNMEDNIL